MKKEKGFSLIEVLIATAIFAVGTLALIGAQMASIKSNKSSYEFVVASTLVEQKIEEIRAVGLDALIDGADGAPVDALGRTKDFYTSNNLTEPDDSTFMFTRTWTVAALVGNQYTLDVETAWTDLKTNANHSVFSNTIVQVNP